MSKPRIIVTDLDGTLTEPHLPICLNWLEPKLIKLQPLVVAIRPLKELADRFFARARPNKELIAIINEANNVECIVVTGRFDCFDSTTKPFLERHQLRYCAFEACHTNEYDEKKKIAYLRRLVPTHSPILVDNCPTTIELAKQIPGVSTVLWPQEKEKLSEYLAID